jgi:hypothetical protein
MSLASDRNNIGSQRWSRIRRRRTSEGGLSSRANNFSVSANQVSQRGKIIVGLDYGTTFSGMLPTLSQKSQTNSAQASVSALL